MARPNDEVGALLQEYADLVAITGGDAYRARVYEKAARSVAGYHADVSTLDAAGLRRIPNVGTSIADKIVAYFRTGHIDVVEELRAKIPAGVRELTAIPTLGPRKAMVLYDKRGISSVPELLAALDAGKLTGLKGFGPKTEENLRHGIELLQQIGSRVHINVAMEVAEGIVAELSAVTGCDRCTYAGSLRRMRETIGDIDILAASRHPQRLMETLTHLDAVSEVIAHGETKTSVRTTHGMQVDLRVVRPEAWGAALQYFTGSKPHNVRTREIAVRQKLKLSEYGLFEVGSGKLIVSKSEDEVYARLGLPWIPPPLREDRGEIEAALAGELPTLVTQRDIRGDLHTHTNLTDGVASLGEMVAAAAARGYSYYAITDHAPNLSMQRMTDEKMLAQRAEVRALEGRYGKLRLLHGTELNIDPDGEVDWGPEFLAGFDICVASVHSHFTQSRDEMTKRLLRACENPYVNIIGHPTGRLIGQRPPVEADLDAVFKACARTGTALEVNAFPDRLDLNDECVLRAKRYGVKFAIDTDAHAVAHLDMLRYGIGTAQRGWLTRDDVINTWPLRRLKAFLRKGRS
ncbi:DNA polymerase/3'-5' exonuclease PolX [Actinopolymorpha alba]|uniref:DNA polymerase/3'-5' exonuclease PolX n=1 Tax=Actinopolymorpha alba TaxID=533267 RepID=UPI00035F7416|nr:DNA polymerase/3'-5' exonuclease PolX [Actinopolymorpha alba]